jgi:hypothetical protein
MKMIIRKRKKEIRKIKIFVRKKRKDVVESVEDGLEIAMNLIEFVS